MENVVAFNNELSGLYDSKPPISKAKMAAITKAAMRAIKFYKHVVQSVEKFILKCKPEYKVPGLYVIDSIVRQSRQQFGPEKDVFAPRFARNITETFANLFRCAPDDKSRIIRVLNLWQKNSVFAPEVIQPIFDLADPNHPIYQLPPGTSASNAGLVLPGGSGAGMQDMSSTSNGLNMSNNAMDISMSGGGGGVGMQHAGGSGGIMDDKLAGLPDLSASSSSHDKKQQQRYEQHGKHYLKRHQAAGASTSGTAASTSKGRGDLHGVHSSSSSYDNITSLTKVHNSEAYAKYTKASLDVHFNEVDDDDHHNDDDDSSDDDDANVNHNNVNHHNDSSGDNTPTLNSSNLLDNNNLKQLLQDPNVLRQLQTLQNFQKFKQQEEKQHKLNEMRLQEEAFEKHLQNVLKGTAGGSMSEANEYNKEVEFVSEEQKIEVINLDGNDSRSPTPERDRYKRNRRSSRSRSRSRSRDRRDRDRRSRRSRSRSRSRSPRSSNRRRSSRDRDRDRSNRDKERDREHDRERRKKGLPDLKKEHLSVCSTTLWVGHLSKLVYQEELSDTFGEFGDIVSIDQIVPRGCAFIVMNRRQDAYKAMQSLKNHKLQGRTITISWAAGKGVKSKEWKDYWDLDLGVTYIPWSKINEKTDFDSLEEGGMFDDDSMPSWMKDKINRNKNGKEKVAEQMPPTVPSGGPVSAGMLFGIDTTQPPPGPPPPGGPPPMAMPPMGMPGQFTMAPPMGAPPRMLGPMGMPIAGIHMPPNMVPGMPPMLGMMPPGFPPMPGQPPAGPMGTHLGMPPGATQFPPPPTAAAGGTAGGVPPPLSAPGVSNSNISNDDQMDIEMDDDDGAAPGGSGLNAQLPNAPPAMNFSQPPPMFGGNPPPGTEPPNLNDGLFNRDRQRGGMNEQRGGPGGGNSRWGGRGGGVDDGAEDNDNGGQRWRENGGSFNEGGGRMAAGRGGGGPMNIQAIDGAQQRPDFLNEFDGRGGGQGRGGGGGRGAGNHNGDFYGNMPPNRFNQPTSLMQMRIPPPNAFNQRMGGPGGGPMFMRGGGQGGNSGGQVGAGGRPQGPGFFNPRNPFGRDNGEAGGRGGGGGGLNSRGGRGGGGRGGRGNNAPPGVGGIWSDEEGDDSMNNFKRRGGGPPGAGPPGVNRFRDNRENDDRNSRDRGGARGGGPRGMGGPGNRFERDSNERDRERSRDRDRDRDSRSRGPPGTRRFSRDENSKIVDDGKKSKSQQQDTEEDWDQELEEYRPSENAKKQAAAAFNKNTPAKTDTTPIKSTATTTTTNAHDNQKKTPIETSETAPAAQASSNAEQEEAKEEFAKPTIAAETAAAVGNKNNDVPSSPVPAAAAPIATTTPLYDELPAAGFNNAGNDKVAETPQAKHTPQEQPPATSVTTPKVVEVTQQAAAAAAAEFVPTPTKPIETQPAEIISDSITTTTTKTSAEATTTNSRSAVNEPKHVTAVDVSDVTVGTLNESAPEETAAEN